MRVYLNPIAVGILLSLLIIYFLFIPILVHQYRSNGTLRIRKNIVIASFIIYMITAWFMTVLPLPSFESVLNMQPIRPNIKPFLFINTFLENSNFILTKPETWITSIRNPSFYTVAFNIVLTIPFGVYLRKYFKLNLLCVIILGFLLSSFYEITQFTGFYGIYPKAFRVADVDDLIINTLGTIIGYFLEKPIDILLPNPTKDRTKVSGKASLLRRVLSFLIDSIIISIIFELSRVAVNWNHKHNELNIVILLISETIVFILIPLITKNNRTIGMTAFKLTFKNNYGESAKVSHILLHNLFIGMCFHFSHKMHEMTPYYILDLFFQLLFIITFIILIVKSLFAKKVCYYWESWFDTYLKADLPQSISSHMEQKYNPI